MAAALARMRVVVSAVLTAALGIAVLPAGSALSSGPAPSAAPAVSATSDGGHGGDGVVGGWFGYWTPSSQIADVVAASGGTADDVMMFMWAFAGAGDPACLINPYGGNCVDGATATRYDEARRSVQAAGGHFYASHTDLDYGRRGQLSDYLSTPENRTALADLLTARAVAAGVDGVDLDWENFAFNDGQSTWPATKERFVDTIRRLGQALHAQGKRLSVTVPGGYSPLDGTGNPVPGGGYWVYAWTEIAPYIDRLRLMAYDYSFSRPAGIGPNDWAEKVVISAKAQVGAANARKVWIGTPQYGRRWAVPQSDGTWGQGSCPSSWRPSTMTSSLGLPGVRSRQQDYAATPTWDATIAEWTFRYTATTDGGYYRDGVWKALTCRANHQIWYADQATAKARLGLVAKHGIGGIAVWNLGGLEADFFSAGLADLARRITRGKPVDPPVKPPVVARLSAPDSAPRGEVGRVRVKVVAGEPVMGLPVLLGFQRRGSDAVRWGRSRVTDENGRAVFTRKFRHPGRFIATSAPGAKVTFTRGAALRIEPTLQVVATPTIVSARRAATYSGRLYPARAGATVTRLLRTKAGWVKQGRTTTTDAAGSFVLRSKTVATPIRNRSKFVATSGSGFTSAVSNIVTVTVTPGGLNRS